MILETVAQAQVRSGQPLREILPIVGLPRATYYHWQERAAAGQLADRLVLPQRQVVLPTPAEVAAVRSFALDHPAAGYKRLAWMMVDEDVAYLRPYQVYRILVAQNLMTRRPAPAPEVLRRPPAPDHPDQAWHIDLMYLRIGARWYYLVDIVDGYSRYLVHWSLNLTMLTDTVTLTVQEALDQLPTRRPGEPQIIHDHGSQFISAEWRTFVEGAGVTDIPTRVAHPQSNGVVERLHRTHREEGLPAEVLAGYYQALGTMAGWSDYYNYHRPHSALGYLRPVDYYRGDPATRLAGRQQKLAQAVADRKAYWQEHLDVKERG